MRAWYNYLTMKTQNELRANRDYQIYTWKTNGDESIRAWFTYEEAEKKVKQLMNEDLTISCYEILLDKRGTAPNETVAQGVQAVSE